MLLLDDGGGDGGEAAACRCGAGIRSEKRARSGREAGEKRARSGRVRNGGEGGGAHTAYEEEDEPLPDEVSEAEGHEGAGNSRFVTSPSARRRFATPRWATSASRASCIQKLGGTRLPSVHCFSSRCYYCRLNTERITRCKWLTSLICFFSVLAGLFRLRPPNTHIEARVSFGSLLRCTRSLYPLLLAKPPGTGVHEAGIQYCMVVTSQLVCALVWTNPCRGMEIELPAILGPDNLDNMDES